MREVPKIDNSTIISSDIVGFKDALKEVRRQQEYQLHQINSLKASQADKNTTDMIVLANK